MPAAQPRTGAGRERLRRVTAYLGPGTDRALADLVKALEAGHETEAVRYAINLAASLVAAAGAGGDVTVRRADGIATRLSLALPPRRGR